MRKAEIECNRFGLAEEPVTQKRKCTTTESTKKNFKAKTLPAACFRLSSQDVKIADNRALSVVNPSADFAPRSVFSKPSQLKSHDWKEVCLMHVSTKCFNGFDLISALVHLDGHIAGYTEV